MKHSNNSVLITEVRIIELQTTIKQTKVTNNSRGFKIKVGWQKMTIVAQNMYSGATRF